jgi:hypothetical protein
MTKDWACAPRAGWEEYRRARARYLAMLAELAAVARLERAWAAPAMVPPRPGERAGGAPSS